MRPPVLPGLFTVPLEQMTGADFDGATYQPVRDKARLSRQLTLVAGLLEAGEWWTLDEIAARTNIPTQSISARIRDLRKPKFGGWEIEHRVREGHIYWEYRRRV